MVGVIISIVQSSAVQQWSMLTHGGGLSSLSKYLPVSTVNTVHSPGLQTLTNGRQEVLTRGTGCARLGWTGLLVSNHQMRMFPNPHSGGGGGRWRERV